MKPMSAVADLVHNRKLLATRRLTPASYRDTTLEMLAGDARGLEVSLVVIIIIIIISSATIAMVVPTTRNFPYPIVYPLATLLP